jgi:hypothetical protein
MTRIFHEKIGRKEKNKGDKERRRKIKGQGNRERDAL